MKNRIMRIRFAAICALLLCAVAFATSADTIAVPNTNDSDPLATPTPTATPCASVGSWTEQAPYPIAVSGHAVVSQGGNVYSFGGIVNNAAIVNAYTYSSATNTWTPIASLPAPRGWFSGASDGTYIYLLGGVDQNFNTTATLWRYDPVSNTYNTSLASYTIPTYFHASAYLNGKIYRIAGAAIGTDFHVEVYDIATNTWSMAANYPFANHTLMAAALGNYVYAGGGNASPSNAWRYDPNTNTWTAIADLPAGRSAAASGTYNGRWILVGGDVNFAISTSAIAWDPATNSWCDLPNMIQARDYLAGATAGQSFYAVAGASAPGTGTDDNQQYTEIPCATPTPTATPNPTPTPTPGQITLSARGYKVQGRQAVDLSWNGANSNNIDIYRNGVLIATVPNIPGFYTDQIGARGKGTYTYRICDAGTQNCSNQVTARFGGG